MQIANRSFMKLINLTINQFAYNISYIYEKYVTFTYIFMAGIIFAGMYQHKYIT